MTVDVGGRLGADRRQLVPRSRLVWALISLLVFRVVLDISYCLLISKVYTYNLPDFDASLVRLGESYVLLVVVFFVLPKTWGNISSILAWMLILLSYVPVLTLFAFADVPRTYVYASSGFWVLFLVLLNLPAPRLPRLKQSGVVLLLLGLCLTAFAFVVLFVRIGFSVKLDLSSVYTVRDNFVSQHIPLVGYVFNWVGLIILPASFAWFVSKKNWVVVLLLLLLELLLFSGTGIRTYLFALPFVLMLMWLVGRRDPLPYMPIGLAATVGAGMGSYWLLHDVWIAALFTKRTLFTPAHLSFLYYDFFSAHEHTFLSSSVLRFVVHYPYDLDPPHLIGAVYFGSPAYCANTGVVGNAYMNFGFVGFVLFAVMLAMVVRAFDSCSRGVDRVVAVGAVAVPAITLTNGSLLGNLLTNGVLVAMLVLYLMPRKGEA